MEPILQSNRSSGQFFEDRFLIWSARHGDVLRNGPYILNEAVLARVAGGKLDRIVDSFRNLKEYNQGDIGNWKIIHRYLGEFVEAQTQTVEQYWARLITISRARDNPMNLIMDKIVQASDKLADTTAPPKGEARIRLEDEIRNYNKALQQAISTYDSPHSSFHQDQQRLQQMNWEAAEKFLHADSVKAALLSLQALSNEVLEQLEKQQKNLSGHG